MRRVDCVGAVHAGFLIDRGDEIKLRVQDLRVGEDRHRVGKGDAVVAAEAGASGAHKRAVREEVKPLGGHILLAVTVLHGNHVHVALDDDAGLVLVAGRRVRVHDHVAAGLLHITESVLRGKCHKIIADRLRVARSARNPADLLKIPEDRLGRKPGKNL